jgi:hypothetical protein
MAQLSAAIWGCDGGKLTMRASLSNPLLMSKRHHQLID